MAGEQRTLTFPDAFVWIDVVNPTKKQLDTLAKQYNLHATSVKDCLEPEHLPKFERINGVNFFILRAFDEHASITCDTVQELTRKIAIFSGEKFLITVHRKDQAFLKALRERWQDRVSELSIAKATPPDTTHDGVGEVGPLPQPKATVLSDIIKESFYTFEKPIDDGLDRLEEFEMSIFAAEGAKPFKLRDGYYLKRKAFVFKRILRYSQDVLTKISISGDPGAAPFYQDLRETLDGIYFYSDELLENVNSLLNLHISLSSQITNEASLRTNEVVRVLTVFSIFFMPLNFIAGIYGMNFEYMPELRHHNGYFIVLFTMVAVAIGIYSWLHSKGWLHRRDFALSTKVPDVKLPAVDEI